MFLLYLTDAWHTHASKELLGAFSCRENACSAAKQHCRKHNRKNPLRDDEMYMLYATNQTQNREFNYMIEPVNIDKLL